MSTTRVIFPSFDWDEDIWRVNQIIHFPDIVGCKEAGFRNGVPPETVKRSDAEIAHWIRENMNGCSCLICFVGEKTYTSKWVKYELQLARQYKMGRLFISLKGMKNKIGIACRGGQIPCDEEDGYGLVLPTQYQWLPSGQDHINHWIEDAIYRARCLDRTRNLMRTITNYVTYSHYSGSNRDNI